MRNFYTDPSVKSDWRITFGPNAVTGGLGPAVGYCAKVSGLSIKFEKYEIKEGGRITPRNIPIGVASPVVTFDSLIFDKVDGSIFVNYYLQNLMLRGPMGLHGTRASSSAQNSSVDVLVERLSPFATGGSITGRVVYQRIHLRYGMLEEYAPVDEISPTDGLSVNKLVICFDLITVER